MPTKSLDLPGDPPHPADDKAKNRYGRLELIWQKDVYYGSLQRCCTHINGCPHRGDDDDDDW